MSRISAAVLVLALCPTLVLPAKAATVDLVFAPPVITSGPICAPRPTDEALIARWQGYDGAALPDGDTALIKRDLRRLIEMDPRRWFDVVGQAQAQFATLDPSYSQTNILLDRIELLVAAGRLPDLAQARLVDQLLTMDLSQSPRAQVLLAQYLTRGIGIARDPARGDAMLLSAAFGGNADAILTLVERQVAGTPVPGWDVPPDLAVTMAFGALVGRLDPLICDRVNRIAREYDNGDIVTRDVALSERWYRFAADLGDALAAWRVAEMHLRAEDVDKDNAVLLHYLTAAANADLPYAQVMLGRIEATGALVPRDLTAAEASYRAADTGIWAQGAPSYVLFLQEQSRQDDAWTQRYTDALAALVASDAAPAWALIAEADLVLDAKGRWAGEAEARALLERAAALGELAAVERLSALQFREAKTPAEFYAVLDSMIQVVISSGQVDPMISLSNAFICRAPNAPQVAEADYWQAVSDATATLAVAYTPAELDALAATRDPLAEAEIQTQALSGRVAAIAQYMYLIERRDAPAETIAFWDDYATRFPGVLGARAALDLKAATTPGARAAALDRFRAAARAGDTVLGADFASALLEEPTATPESQAEALAILLPMAARGIGKAMQMLPLADPERFPTLKVVYEAYTDVIAARGDFDALLLALPLIDDPAVFADYLNRATAITGCTFDDALRIADAIGRSGDRALFDRWLRIADYLAAGRANLLANLGDLLSRHGTDADEPQVLAYYETARLGGSRAAIHRLLNLYSRRTAAAYDPERSAALFVDLVAASGPQDLPGSLSRLRSATPEIRAIARRSIDEAALYLSAAQSGSAVAMREYALLLRADATTPAQILESTDWLRRAADAGQMAAMIDLADALVFGVGTAPSRDQALGWLEKAADLGSADAAQRLRTLQLSSGVGQ